LTQSWQVLTPKVLFSLVRLEATQRKFLKSGTFSFQLKDVQGKASLECWGVGKHHLLYRSLWRLTGVCLFEWSAFLPTQANEKARQKDWEIYGICKSLNGSWQ
jgi:hypothetical protein